MRNFILICFLIIPLYGFAQKFPCGVDSPSEDEAKYISKNIVAKESQYARNTTSGTIYVGIIAHIIRTSSGTGGLSLADLNTAIAELNNDYQSVSSIDVEYFIKEINYINSDTYYNFLDSEEASLVANHNQTNGVNVYFANTVSDNGTNQFCGYAYFPSSNPDRNFIMMRNECTGTGNTTLQHEFGHYWSLYHTFETSQGLEYVDGSNSVSTGDLITDTPADPNPNDQITVNADCTHNGSTLAGPINGNASNTDPSVGNYANAPIDNIMSYHPEKCVVGLTEGQLVRANAGLADRGGHGSYDIDPIPTTVSAPTNLTINQGQNGVSLSWTDNANNETGYLIKRTDAESPKGYKFIGAVVANQTTFVDYSAASSTSYTYSVVSSNNLSAVSNEQSITTTVVYCRPVYTNACPSDFRITQFTINQTTLNNNSGSTCDDGNYSLDQSTLPTMEAGSSYSFLASIDVNPNQGAFNWFPQSIAIWIDFNEDGDFEDSGELLFQSSASDDSYQHTGNISISSSVSSGNKRLRIRSRDLSGGLVLSSCDNYSYGETEDYVVVITGGQTPNAAPTASNLQINGNITNVLVDGVAVDIEGEEFTASFDYSDSGDAPNPDPEDPNGHLFTWYRGNSASDPSPQVVQAASNDNTYVATGADVGKFIRFGVRPAAQSGTILGDEVASGYSQVIRPVSPTLTNENIQVNSANQVTVTWTDNSAGEDGFVIQYSQSSDFSSGVTSVPVNAPNTQSQVISGLSAGTTYYFRVAAIKNN